jgi:hypothetical protein
MALVAVVDSDGVLTSPLDVLGGLFAPLPLHPARAAPANISVALIRKVFCISPPSTVLLRSRGRATAE